MRFFGLKADLSWDYLGWFILALIVLIITIIIINQFSGSSFTLIDKIFGFF